MDPNANLAEVLELAGEITRRMDRGPAPTEDQADRLAELVLALDGWIAGGGFLPARWSGEGSAPIQAECGDKFHDACPYNSKRCGCVCHS